MSWEQKPVKWTLTTDLYEPSQKPLDLLSCVRLDTGMMVWVMSPQMLAQTERLRGLVTCVEGEKLAVLWNDGSESWAYRENLLEARLG